MKTLFEILGIAFVLSWVPALVIFFRDRRRFSGKRIVTCPETKRVATIQLDSVHAAATTLTGDPDLKVDSCSRWDGPVGHCGEQCVETIETALSSRLESA